MTSGVCDMCGKVLKSSNPEAMAAHKRESSSCSLLSGGAPSKNAPAAVKKAEEALAEIIADGHRLQAAGTFEELEQHAVKRKEAEQAVKKARSESKAEKAAIKQLAANSMSAANWTSCLTSALDGNADDGRFSKGESAIEERLASETVGLVTSAQFKEKREALAAEGARKREEEARAESEARAERARKKQEKKRKREAAERRGLSFAEEAED